MSDSPLLGPGLYERLVDLNLAEQLAKQSDLKSILGRLEDAESPEVYGQFVSHLVTQALRTSKPESRLILVNRLVGLISSIDGLEYFSNRMLVEQSDELLLALQASMPDGSFTSLPRPVTPLSFSSLLTGARYSRRLVQPKLRNRRRNDGDPSEIA